MFIFSVIFKREKKSEWGKNDQKKRVVDDCELIDMGYIGEIYTWNN